MAVEGSNANSPNRGLGVQASTDALATHKVDGGVYIDPTSGEVRFREHQDESVLEAILLTLQTLLQLHPSPLYVGNASRLPVTAYLDSSGATLNIIATATSAVGLYGDLTSVYVNARGNPAISYQNNLMVTSN